MRFSCFRDIRWACQVREFPVELHIFAQYSVLRLGKGLSACYKINGAAIRDADRTRAVQSEKLPKGAIDEVIVGYLVHDDAPRRSERRSPVYEVNYCKRRAFQKGSCWSPSRKIAGIQAIREDPPSNMKDGLTGCQLDPMWT